MSEDVNPTPEGAPVTPVESGAKASDIPQDLQWVSSATPAEIAAAIQKLQEKSTTRLDDLNAIKAERDRLAAEKQRAEDARLAEEKKWEELATKRAAENEALQAKLKDAALDRAVITAAADLKFHNWQEAKKLADLSGVDTSTNDGGASAVTSILEQLAKDSPHLIRSEDGQSQPQQGAGVMNPTGKVSLRFKDLQAMDREQIMRLSDEEIEAALRDANNS